MGALPDQPWRCSRECRARPLGKHGTQSRGPFLSLGNLCQYLSSGAAGTGARDREGLEEWRPGRGERDTAQCGLGKKQLMGLELGMDIRGGIRA